MNGRVYDPQLGRFLSADSVVDDAGDMQAFNRYSYVHNNPLAYTDPSGHSFFSSLWKRIKSAVWKSVKPFVKFDQHMADIGTRAVGRLFAKVPALQIVGDVILAIIPGCAVFIPLFNAAVSASVVYESTGSLSGALTSGAVAYAASYVTMQAGAAGSAYADTLGVACTPGSQAAGSMIASSVVGGAISKAQGGKFFDSRAFVSGMAISSATSYVMNAAMSARKQEILNGQNDNQQTQQPYESACVPTSTANWGSEGLGEYRSAAELRAEFGLLQDGEYGVHDWHLNGTFKEFVPKAMSDLYSIDATLLKSPVESYDLLGLIEKTGAPVMVSIRNGMGGFHAVLVENATVSPSGSTFVVNDPMYKNYKTYTSSEFNEVYAKEQRVVAFGK
jgi:hypothetical protein